jgi:hypothetical protein
MLYPLSYGRVTLVRSIRGERPAASPLQPASSPQPVFLASDSAGRANLPMLFSTAE